MKDPNIAQEILGYFDGKVRGDNHSLPTLDDGGSIVGGELGEKWSGGYIDRKETRKKKT